MVRRAPATVVAAEMAAGVIEVCVAPGQQVAVGDTLVMLESMKMEIPVLSERAGIVTVARVRAGDVVQEGDPLVVVEH